MNAAKPKLLKQTVFSKTSLLAFALAFGLVGGYILLRTFASPNPNLPGDLNGDNTVGITDLSILLSNYGTTNPTADINLDGTVNILDLSILLSHWGQSYSPPPPGSALKWKPPGYDGTGDPKDPTNYPAYTVLNIPETGPYDYYLNAGQDYFVKFTTGKRLQPLRFNGGRNLVLMGGEVYIDTPSTTPDDHYVFKFLDQDGGTVHMEGMWVHGSTVAGRGCTGGMKFRGPNEILQLENDRIDQVNRLDANASLLHADVIQTWSGPSEAHLYNVSAASDYVDFLWMNASIGTPGFVYPGKVFADHVNTWTLANPFVPGSLPTNGNQWQFVSPTTEFHLGTSVYANTGYYSMTKVGLKDVMGYRNGGVTATCWSYQEFHASGMAYSPEVVSQPCNYQGGQANQQDDYIVFTRPSTDNIWNYAKTGTGKILEGEPSTGDYVPLGVAGVSYVSPGYQ